MRDFFLLLSSTLGLIANLAAAAEPAVDGFEGWQAMRVIHQQGSPQRLLAVDLDGQGRQALVVVNHRQGRLDIYRWVPGKERQKPTAADPTRPNELPMAPEWSHHELALDNLPQDVAAHDLDADGKPELLVLCANPTRVQAYKQSSTDRWQQTAQWELLTGTPTGHGRLMLVRKLSGKQAELLVSFEQGIQVVPLVANSRATWLSPRESRGRNDWDLVDLNGDGTADLVEWSPQAHQTVRWFEGVDGKLLPAQVLYEHNIQGLGALPVAGKPADLLLLGGTQDGLVRRFQLSQGAASPLGRADALPMPGGAKAAWCGLKIGDRTVIVAADSAQPRLRVHELTASGWQAEQSFPTLSNVRAMVAPAARPGMLLLWIKEGADLQQCVWENERLSYPRPFAEKADSDDRRIVALDTVGETTWWAQRVGSNLDLYVWSPDQKEPQRKRFAGAGTKVEKVVWLGGSRLLTQQAYASAAKLLVLDEAGKVTSSDPPQLAKVDLNEFILFERREKSGEHFKLGRLTDGVLQWLAADLAPEDQLMLPEGQKLAAFATPPGDKGGWALEQGGAFIHRLEPDAGGVLRVTQSIRPPHGTQLREDAVLGLILIDTDRIVRLSPGKPFELKLLDSIDGRVGRPSGVKEATIHRMLIADVDGDRQLDLLLCDDRRHQLTFVRRSDTEMKSVMSWQVFDDQAYPYGGQSEARVAEPRNAAGLDADGDGHQDLALLSHDRIIIYQAREQSK